MCTTYQASVYRECPGRRAGTGCTRSRRRLPPSRALRTAVSAPLAEIPVPVPANLAHVYSECARIWNPIHTDLEVARRMGLPDIILHGSATLALAVSRVVDHAADGDPNRVRRLGGMFRGMVLMPSEIRLRLHADELTGEGRVIAWDVLNAEGQPAITKGFVVLAQ